MKNPCSFRGLLFFCGAILNFTLVTSAGEILPEIEAKQFESTPSQMSKSGRVYLFKTARNTLPRVGSLILIYNAEKPTMAFRVLRSDREKEEYIAKKVRRYDTTQDLKLKHRYYSVEKVADIVPTPVATEAPLVPTSNVLPIAKAVPQPVARPVTILEPKVTGEPAATKEPLPTESELSPPLLDSAPLEPTPLEQEPANTNAPLTAELPPADAPSTDAPAEEPPPPPPRTRERKTVMVEDYDRELDDTTSPHEVEGEDDFSPFEVEERALFEPLTKSFSIMGGILRNASGFVIPGENLNGLLLNYSSLWSRDVFVLSRTMQDSLNWEWGVGYYTRTNGDALDETYTVVPFQGQFRYDVQFSKSMSWHLYVGLQYNAILASETGSATGTQINASTDALQGLQPTMGGGLIFNFGPHWYFRADLGWDKITAGLMIKW